jgi:hypothetical protein
MGFLVNIEKFKRDLKDIAAGLEQLPPDNPARLRAVVTLKQLSQRCQAALDSLRGLNRCDTSHP